MVCQRFLLFVNTELPTVLFYGTFSIWGFRPVAFGSCHQHDVPIVPRPEARSAPEASVRPREVRERSDARG